MAKFANELIASMEQAAAHARGRKVKGMRVTKREVPDGEGHPARTAHVAAPLRGSVPHPAPDAQELVAGTASARRAGRRLSARDPAPAQGSHGSGGAVGYIRTRCRAC
jgi:hypothetical protein